MSSPRSAPTLGAITAAFVVGLCSLSVRALPLAPEAAAAKAQALLENGQAAAVLAKASVFDAFIRRQTEPLKPGVPGGDYHVRFDRTYQGVPVVGGDIIVHLLADGSLERVTTSLPAPLNLPTAKPRIDRASVLAHALDRFRSQGRDASSTVALVVAAWTHIAPVPMLAWRVEVIGVYCGHPSRMQYWFNALTGTLLNQYDEQESAVPMTCTRHADHPRPTDPKQASAPL